MESLPFSLESGNVVLRWSHPSPTSAAARAHARFLTYESAYQLEIMGKLNIWCRHSLGGEVNSSFLATSWLNIWSSVKVFTPTNASKQKLRTETNNEGMWTRTWWRWARKEQICWKRPLIALANSTASASWLLGWNKMLLLVSNNLLH